MNKNVKQNNTEATMLGFVWIGSKIVESFPNLLFPALSLSFFFFFFFFFFFVIVVQDENNHTWFFFLLIA